MSDVVITGIPRSGTTLTCHLLNSLPDTVALHEPMVVSEFSKLGDRQAVRDEIERFFLATRKSIAEGGTAISKQVDGQVPDNPVGGTDSGTFSLRRYLIHLPRRLSEPPALRKSRAARGQIKIDKQLSQNFLLCIKHPSAFTALLPTLIERFPAFAVVRNPLAVLGSWNSVEFKVGRGRAPAAERLDRGLASDLARIPDRFDRQIHLLSWYFKTYTKALPDSKVLRYENIVASGGQALSIISPQAESIAAALQNKNLNKLYDHKLMSRLGEKLLRSDGPYWEYYTKQSVEDLLNGVPSEG